MMHLLILLAALSAEPVGPPQVIVAVGVAGEDQYGAQFEQWAATYRAAAQTGGTACTNVTSREDLQKALAAAPHDGAAPLYIVLIGHGTWDGRMAKFNLAGPDMSAEDLLAWLTPIKRPVVIINVTSCSGPFVPALSAPNRVVIAATKSGEEIQFARFGGFFADALTSTDADRDKDGQVSVLEAFVSAAEHTAGWYAAEGRIQTEHSLLDDNGDRRGVRADAIAQETDDVKTDGRLARTLCLVPSAQDRALSPAQMQRRDELETQVALLRKGRGEMKEDEYYAKLEVLLVELARLYRAGAPAALPLNDTSR